MLPPAAGSSRSRNPRLSVREVAAWLLWLCWCPEYRVTAAHTPVLQPGVSRWGHLHLGAGQPNTNHLTSTGLTVSQDPWQLVFGGLNFVH